ncbi:hypothetical protein QTI17_02330 [Variovorax sp. J31P179]|uniref:hypothetical protein n=1 Tax=Variovorax sp. J31P179 TaxID=3053508 RepID=UPI002578D618|nr:hypothetical protein [Variovorax sp. J31P179]MDM0079420.1 hypothetical protein [Variovorax sp. J31P179]
MSSNPDLNPDFEPNSDLRETDLSGPLDASANTDATANGGLANEDSRPVESLSNWFEQTVQPVAPETARAYMRNYYMMVERAAATLNLDPHFVSIDDLLAQLHDDTTITVGTKNTYASAIAWALKQPDFDFPPAVREHGLALVRNFNPRGGPAQEVTRNSRVSARTIPQEDLGPVLNALLGARITKQAWATKTTSWLNAGIATGARPGEWESAYRFDRDRRILRLPNAKLRKQAPFRWQHIPERLLNRADADLASMAEADLENISIVVAAAKRHSELLARNLAFFDEAEAGTDSSNAEAIDTLRRLRAWELHNAGLAWRDSRCPCAGSEPSTPTSRTCSSPCPANLAGGPPNLQALLRRVQDRLRTACLSAFPDKRLYSLYDTRSTAAANMQATIGAEAAAAVMGHYMKRKRTIKANYAGPDRAYRGAGRFAPGLADTGNQRDQAADRSADHSGQADVGGLGGVSSAPTGNGQAAG